MMNRDVYKEVFEMKCHLVLHKYVFSKRNE